MSNMSSTLFPSLTTERLTLRQLSVDDQQNIFALRSDPAINQYLGRQACQSMEDAADFIKQIQKNIKKNKSLYWAIDLTETQTFVGSICLFDFSAKKSTCEIGFELFTHFQGQGIMQEAAAKVIDYAFLTLQFQKIIAFTHQDNEPSIKLLRKLNFIRSVAVDQENSDLQIFTLTKPT